MKMGLEVIGRQIGAYRVDSLIGAGGYSRVYLGIDENVDRKAAIKVLLPSESGQGYSETVIQRFEREARIVAKLRDPHSVQLYEYGQTDDGMLYMIFEFIEGDTLEDVRRQHGALPALRVVKIVEQVLLSLEEAHTMGLVHRDIKPANIMLFEHIGRKDQVKVLDFGVGKAVGADATRQDITQAGMLIGTPRYMAPEQWSSDEELNQQTDIYSLGLVVYELLTGRKAIDGTEPVHIMKQHLDDTPIELPEDLDIPSGLRRVVDKMLEKDRAARYGSAAEVLGDLTRLKPANALADTLEVDERRLNKGAGPPTAELAERSDAVEVETGPANGGREDDARDGAGDHKIGMLALIGVGFVAAAIGIFFAFSPEQPAPVEPDVATDEQRLDKTAEPQDEEPAAIDEQPVEDEEVAAAEPDAAPDAASESDAPDTGALPQERAEIDEEAQDEESADEAENVAKADSKERVEKPRAPGPESRQKPPGNRADREKKSAQDQPDPQKEKLILFPVDD